MIRPSRRGLVALATCAALACVAGLRSARLRDVAALRSLDAAQVGAVEGWPWPTRLMDATWRPSPHLAVDVARVELGGFMGPRSHRAEGVVVRAQAPIEVAWEEARALDVPAGVEARDVRLELTESPGRTLRADGVSFARGPEDHLHARTLRALGATFRDVHLWVDRPSTALELRLAPRVDDPKAPKLRVTRTAGQGVEWSLDVPSQPFTHWASRIGLRLDATWDDATFVGVGSVVVPDSPSHPARANVRFTIDAWHRPHWPEAALLTGRSGAIALRLSPGPAATHPITRVEVSAGLFSLAGRGELTFGEPSRLVFDAHGELSCARLLAHLPPSRHREQVQSFVSERGEEAANTTSVRLELAVAAEAPSERPLRFRWHLRAGCGLAEMSEEE